MPMPEPQPQRPLSDPAPRHCPALFLTACSSGQGKTTLVAALARHHHRRGRRVRVFKTGPDFLDPMILSRASGARSGRSISGWWAIRLPAQALRGGRRGGSDPDRGRDGTVRRHPVRGGSGRDLRDPGRGPDRCARHGTDLRRAGAGPGELPTGTALRRDRGESGRQRPSRRDDPGRHAGRGCPIWAPSRDWPRPSSAEPASGAGPGRRRSPIWRRVSTPSPSGSPTPRWPNCPSRSAFCAAPRRGRPCPGGSPDDASRSPATPPSPSSMTTICACWRRWAPT